MHRFLVRDFKFWEDVILEDKKLVFQIFKVLRFSEWDILALFDWKKNIDYIYKINEIEKDKLALSFEKEMKKNSELMFDLNLYQAIPNKISKIEYILQKATEVWFKKIIFFRSKRSQKLNISENKIERFKNIVLEATEQSWRNLLPEIVFVNEKPLSWILSHSQEKEATLRKNYTELVCDKLISWKSIFLHTIDSEDSSNLKELKLDIQKNINIFIWPEGGFSDEEIDKFNSLNFKKVYLWNRILRTETAWVVVWFFISQYFLHP